MNLGRIEKRELERKIDKIYRNTNNKVRKCMFDDCQDKAIKSHVLQKNGILSKISVNRHLIQLDYNNIFTMQKNGVFNYKKIGINDAYTFSGFCINHDTDVFKPIETNLNLDSLNENKQQSLFCYRGLCQEIRRKEISFERSKEITKINHSEDFSALSDGYKSGIKNLNYFKTELEKAICENNFDSFYFKTIKIPRIDLCISTVLSIFDSEIPYDLDYDERCNNREIELTSFLNVIPMEEYSVIICGYHKSYPCEWTNNFVTRIENGSRQNIFKELSDLITTRLEFWAMSPTLFNNIDKNKIEEYGKVFMINGFNHNEYIYTHLNLFEKII